MKRSVVNLLSGAMILTAILSVSCKKELPALTLDYEKPIEGAITVSQGVAVEIPFTVGALEGFVVAVEAKCDNEDYKVAAALNPDGATGVITLTPPEFILEDASFKITLTATDASNSRTISQEIEVSAKTLLQNLTVASNCHLTSPDTFIKFPAVKGNTTDKLTFAKMELLWEDALGLIDTTFTLGGDAVYVKVAKGQKGNAVVCAKDSEGTIVWSWHIWVSEEDATANSMEYTYTDADGVSTTFRFMDRNIGALTSKLGTADVNGCYYQWGRKDPFPACTYEGTIKAIYDKDGNPVLVGEAVPELENNIETAIQNPLVRYRHRNNSNNANYSWMTTDYSKVDMALVHDLWGAKSNAKSVYDPCPAGYRLPPINGMRFLSDAEIAKEYVLKEGANTEKPAHVDKMGLSVSINGGTFMIPFQGEIFGADEYEASLKYSFGGDNGNPTGCFWSNQLDAKFVEGASKSYFRAHASNVKAYSLGYSSNYNTAYAVGARCIKE